jgi:hypothetical protein
MLVSVRIVGGQLGFAGTVQPLRKNELKPRH